MSGRLDRTLAAAVAAGILPAGAAAPAAEERPWPLLLFTALGAWLAAVPLLVVVSLLLGDLIVRGAGPYLVGGLILTAALVVLRSGTGAGTGAAPAAAPGWFGRFLEQLAVPALLVGSGTLGYGLVRDLPNQAASAALMALALGLGVLLPRPWLRLLCGAAAAMALTLTLHGGQVSWFGDGARAAAWLALHGVLAVWLGGLAAQRVLATRGAGAALAGALEPIAAGWLVATLTGLALLAGMTLLVGAGLGWLGTALASALGAWQVPRWMAGGSALLALAGTAAGAFAWPALRRPWVLALGLVIAALAWFMPTLGGIWLALEVAVLTHRWRLASAAGLAAGWVIGAFYYQLHWALGTKALVLAAAGAALAALAWVGARSGAAETRGPVPTPAAGATRAGSAPALTLALAPWLIGLSGLAALGAVNLGIYERESLIAGGQPVFVALAPVDPRSLMQGDYMRLNFRLPLGSAPDPAQLRGPPPRVVGRRDGRGVAELTRLAQPGEVLGEGEFLIALRPGNGTWTLVTDAWFFSEGEAQRFATARYGEFRVGPDGRALLVGLADAELHRLGPEPRP